MRQVQWRRFTFFDKETITEDIAAELGAEVSCMHTAGGRLYLGDAIGKVTVSDGTHTHTNLVGGKVRRQAYSGPVFALAVSPDGVPPGSSSSSGTPSSAPPATTAAASGNAKNKNKRHGGVVVTLGDDSVTPDPSIGGAAGGGPTGSSVLGGAVGAGGGGGGNGRSPCVLKFWGGADMGVCIRAVDVAAQMRDGQQLRRATGGVAGAGAGGAAGEVPRLTAFAVTPDASQVACGFSDGTTLLLQGDLTRSPLLPPPAPLLIQPGEENPSAVTALHFSKGHARKGGSSVGQPKLLVGYDLVGGSDRGGAVDRTVMPSPGSLGLLPPPPAAAAGGDDRTSLGLLSYDTRTDAEPLVLDEVGCREGCSAFGQSTQEMVVGREDGVYFFSPEDRGGAAGFEGKKRHVGCLWNYILVVSEDERSGRHTVNLYDMRNKLVAYHILLPQGQQVKRISCQGERYDPHAGDDPASGVAGGAGEGLAFILTDRNALLRLRERDTASKLELLFRKNLYPMAISLAYASDHDVSEILEIYRMHGDHLYKKGDFEGAMQQYQCTIGHLDPSYVIRRFLDAQRIGLLTAYLEALHDAGQASSDHTTLLLNCHTKLKDVEKLDRFIHPPSGDTATTQQQQCGALGLGVVGNAGGGAAGAGLGFRPGGEGSGGVAAGANFDVVTAIRVLKSAGHADHAAELARRHGEHDWFLRIQLERAQPDYSGALAYIASLSFFEAAEQLRRRGKPLVAALPEDTTGVLMALCTGRYSSKPEADAASGTTKGNSSATTTTNTNTNTKMAAAEDFVHLYVDELRWLRIFLTYVLREGGRAGPTVADTLLELLLREWAQAGEASSSSSGSGGGGGGRRGNGGLAAKKQRENEVMALLDNPRAGYDADHALVLVQMLNFKPGQLYLYEKLYMTDLVLEHYVDTGDTRNMLRVCRKEGTNNPDVWVQVLSYLVNNALPRDAEQQSPAANKDGGTSAAARDGEGAGDRGDADDSSEDGDEGGGGSEGRWDDVRELLALIERDQVLSPLRVLDILSQNPQLPLWVTRDFLPRFLASSASAAESDAAAASELRESTNKMRAEIQGLRATVQSSSGAGSRVVMELPTFMASELGKGVSKVAVSSSPSDLGGMGGEQAKIHDIKAAQARSASDHEQFFKGLEESADGFGQAASYFGKGVMS